jgi:hypothetical protein
MTATNVRPPDPLYDEFAYFYKLHEKLDLLADMAMPENWTSSWGRKQKNGILLNYLTSLLSDKNFRN